MAHEHHGNCCEHEHEANEHLHQVANQLGSMCCRGQCHHPEHRYAEAEINHADRLAADEEYDEFGNKRKKKKKKLNFLGSWQIAEVGTKQLSF